VTSAKVTEFQPPDVYTQNCSEEEHLKIEVNKQPNGGKEAELLYSWHKRQKPAREEQHFNFDIYKLSHKGAVQDVLTGKRW